MKIRKLTQKDSTAAFELINIIESNLPDKKWWLPIKAEERQSFFNDDYTIFYGAFEGGRLVGASALFLDETEFQDTIAQIKMEDNARVGEIGRCMTLPEFRGQNIMYKINLKLAKLAKKRGLDYLFATAHPDNNPSNKTLQKLGMQNVGYIVKYDLYPRNILLVNVEDLIAH